MKSVRVEGSGWEQIPEGLNLAIKERRKTLTSGITNTFLPTTSILQESNLQKKYAGLEYIPSIAVDSLINSVAVFSANEAFMHVVENLHGNLTEGIGAALIVGGLTLFSENKTIKLIGNQLLRRSSIKAH